MKTRNATMIVLTALTLILSAMTVKAAEPSMHNPYTVLGVRLRGELLEHAADGSAPMSLGMIEFQEIIPCRFISTIEADHYPTQWGGPAFSPNESRTYHPSGVMVDGNWTNPCSEQVPAEAVAIAARIYADSVAGNGIIWLTPGNNSGPYDKLSKVAMRDNERTMAEATIVLRDYAFTVTSQTAGAHMRVDIIGFFIRDPWGRGEKGDRGERGFQGEKGDTGAQGLKGDTGAQGAQGLQGEKGDRGEQGLKGDKGDAGAQGLKGEKGDTGAQGLKGDKGETGAQGLKGDKGETGAQGLKGDKGETGAQGLKGEKGDTGAQGLKGDKGDTGAQGLKGDKGDKGATGDRGLQGEKGATGAQGPIGPMGPQGPAGKDGKDASCSTCCNGGITMASGSATFPPPGNITIYNGAAKANSVIMLVYKDVSNGNALAVVSQANGVFTCSGSPNKPFRYVILNYPE
jgi:hypothetical protein